MMTRMVSAVAAFARSHPRIVPLALLAAGLGVAMFGAISLLTPPVLPKLLLFAAIVIAVLVARPRAAK